MSEEEPTNTTTEQVPVKLVKISAAQENDLASGSKSSNINHPPTVDPYWQHRWFSSNQKLFRDFDKSMPRVWFALFENKLQQCEVTADDKRRNALTSCLPNDVLLVVHDLIVNQPSYENIKERLLQWFEPNMSSRVSELLSCPTITDERPSQFLLMLRTKLARGDISEDMVRELFIAKMPESLRNCLFAMTNASLDELAVTADKMLCSGGATSSKQSLYAVDRIEEKSSATSSTNEELHSRIKALESKLADVTKFNRNSRTSTMYNKNNYSNAGQARGSTSKWPRAGNSKQTNMRYDICWYHQTFGNRAIRCSSPCKFAPGNATRPLQ